MVEAAQECGYLLDFPPTASPSSEAGYLPRDKVLFICTGSQGEPRARDGRIANGEHRDVVLEAGDTAIFSSRVIPGNERSVGRLQNALLARGVEVITDSEANIHVSGHPARDELVRDVPMDAARRSPCRSMARCATWSSMPRWRATCQVPETVVAPNGNLVRLAPGPAEIIDQVHAGRLARDGDGLVPLDGESLRERRKLLWNGAAAATLVIDKRRPGHGAAQGRRLRGIDDGDGDAGRGHLAGLSEMLADLSAAERARRRAHRGGGPPGRAARRARAPRQEAVDGRAHRPHLKPAESLMIGRLNHIAIAVPDLAKAAELYRTVMGAKVSAPKAQPAHGVTVVFVELPNTKIELLHPLGEKSPIANFLARNADGGIHHVCYEVEDIYAARDKLKAQGARVLGDGEPKIGAHDKPVLFLHPKDFTGTLIELEQV